MGARCSGAHWLSLPQRTPVPTPPFHTHMPLQVMGMPGMVSSIVESLKFLTPRAFDIMSFAVLTQLASPKKTLTVGGRGVGRVGGVAFWRRCKAARALTYTRASRPGSPPLPCACALPAPLHPLQDDGVNLEEWYQWLAAFTGLLCKKHGWGGGGGGGGG